MGGERVGVSCTVDGEWAVVRTRVVLAVDSGWSPQESPK